MDKKIFKDFLYICNEAIKPENIKSKGRHAILTEITNHLNNFLGPLLDNIGLPNFQLKKGYVISYESTVPWYKDEGEGIPICLIKKGINSFPGDWPEKAPPKSYLYRQKSTLGPMHPEQTESNIVWENTDFSVTGEASVYQRAIKDEKFKPYCLNFPFLYAPLVFEQDVIGFVFIEFEVRLDFDQKKAGFKITKKSLENLKLEGTPEYVLEKIENIKEQKPMREENFVSILRQEIGEEYTNSFKTLILKHTKRGYFEHILFEHQLIKFYLERFLPRFMNYFRTIDRNERHQKEISYYYSNEFLNLVYNYNFHKDFSFKEDIDYFKFQVRDRKRYNAQETALCLLYGLWGAFLVRGDANEKKTLAKTVLDSLQRAEDLMAWVEGYREHLVHVTKVFLTGCMILDHYRHEKGDELLIFFKEKLGLVSWEEVERAWLLCSTFHDFSMPIQKLKEFLKKYFEIFIQVKDFEVLDKVQFADILIRDELYFRFIQAIHTLYHATMKELPIPTEENVEHIIKKSVQYFADEQNLFSHAIFKKFTSRKGPDHAIGSALSLLRYSFGKGGEEKWEKKIREWIGKPAESRVYLSATLAILLHSLILGKEEDDVKYLMSQGITFCDFPLGVLLSICDCAQDWGRPETPGERSENRPNCFLTDCQFNDNEITFKVQYRYVEKEAGAAGKKFEPKKDPSMAKKLEDYWRDLESRLSIRVARKESPLKFVLNIVNILPNDKPHPVEF